MRRLLYRFGLWLVARYRPLPRAVTAADIADGAVTRTRLVMDAGEVARILRSRP